MSEMGNGHDKHAVSILKDGDIVGYVAVSRELPVVTLAHHMTIYGHSGKSTQKVYGNAR